MDDQRNQSPAQAAEALTEKIFAWRRGFNAMHLIDLGITSGLFEALAATPDVSAADLADRLGLHGPYVETWCTSAYAFELLDADDQRRFRLAPAVKEILAMRGHPRYLGGYVQLGTRFVIDDYRQAVDGLRTGASVPFQGRDAAFSDVVTQAIAGVNVMVARKILPGLAGVAQRLESGGSLLEVGCGSGYLQLQIAKTFAQARCTGIDIDPTGLSAAREAVVRAGVGDRVTILEGDVAQQAPADAFDVVVMVEVLHEISPALRAHVLGGCARALKPGGWLVIVDETYPSTLADSRRDEYRFPVQTGLEEMMWGNVIPTREEQDALLSASGFTGPIERSLFGAGFTLIATRKPGPAGEPPAQPRH
ncbi:MAG: class I SAM-dependent methyltransferase [Burkholderiaceae bacterium]